MCRGQSRRRQFKKTTSKNECINHVLRCSRPDRESARDQQERDQNEIDRRPHAVGMRGNFA